MNLCKIFQKGDPKVQLECLQVLHLQTGEIYSVTCSVPVKVELFTFVMSEGDEREERNGREIS